jgi:hypothetical protein
MPNDSATRSGRVHKEVNLLRLTQSQDFWTLMHGHPRLETLTVELVAKLNAAAVAHQSDTGDRAPYCCASSEQRLNTCDAPEKKTCGNKRERQCNREHLNTTEPRTLTKKRKDKSYDPNAGNRDETEKRRPIGQQDLFKVRFHDAIRENAERLS